jgi:Domain of unknown function (DUF4157)
VKVLQASKRSAKAGECVTLLAYSAANPLRSLHQRLGNRALHSFVQTSLEAGQRHDPLEREADQVADAIVRMPEPATAAPRIQRLCAECEEQMQRKASVEDEEPLVQAKREGEDSAAAIAPYLDSLSGRGEPLAPAARAFMEPRFGVDFSAVRIHTDPEAHRSARAVDALAFTVGRDIVFGAGHYAPDTARGQRLIAHELAHVVQQSGAADATIQRQPPDPNVGPPVSEVPLPPICSVVYEEGRWYWKCENLPKIGSTPKIPLDPRNIPDEIDKILKKSQKEGDKGPTPLPGSGPAPGPGPITIENPDKLVEEMCRRYPFVCQPAPKPSTPLPPGPQLGVLWTDVIHFEKDHPAPGERAASIVLTAAGQKELDSVLSWLNLSSDLEVRLIGSASSEGTEEYNQALATRRVNFVLAGLKARKFDTRVADPLFSDGAETGCERIGSGLWSCGETKADQTTPLADDRVVRVTFMRNKLPPLSLPKIEPPTFKPGPF